MLAQNDLLLEITKKLAGRKPAEEKVLECYRQRFGFGKMHNLGTFTGPWSEACLRASLEEICTDMGDRVIFDPIRPGELIGDFVFERRKGQNMVVLNMRQDNLLLDYMGIDELAVFDGLPTLFEIKLSKNRAHDGGPGSKGTNYAMRPERIDYLLAPLRRRFGKNCAYVLVVIADNYKPDISVTQANFLQAGGILVPFYAKKAEFDAELKLVKEKHGL